MYSSVNPFIFSIGFCVNEQTSQTDLLDLLLLVIYCNGQVTATFCCDMLMRIKPHMRLACVVLKFLISVCYIKAVFYIMLRLCIQKNILFLLLI